MFENECSRFEQHALATNERRSSPPKSLLNILWLQNMKRTAPAPPRDTKGLGWFQEALSEAVRTDTAEAVLAISDSTVFDCKHFVHTKHRARWAKQAWTCHDRSRIAFSSIFPDIWPPVLFVKTHRLHRSFEVSLSSTNFAHGKRIAQHDQESNGLVGP
ncbi:hypothetical protein BKA81DRAFT_145218 [Phyllosticta paracitricarpa]